MTGHPVILPNKNFKTKNEAKNFFKEMLNRYQDKQELTLEDDAILFERLQQHPEASDKIGAGIKRFYRDRSSNHPTSSFHIERTDGSTLKGTQLFRHGSCPVFTARGGKLVEIMCLILSWRIGVAPRSAC